VPIGYVKANNVNTIVAMVIKMFVIPMLG